MGAALDAAKDPASAAASAWLAHARGAAVIVAPDTQAELIGKAPPGGGANEWMVRSATGATLTVAASTIRRVPATRGSQVRVVMGESCGFVGVLLSADNGVGVLRSFGEAKKVRVLPLDALCVLAQECNQPEPGTVEIS